MKPEESLWQRVWTLAERTPIEPPPRDLEERIIAEWKQTSGRRTAASDIFREARWALLGAGAVLVVTCAIAFPILKSPADPSVLLANFAFQHGLTHE